MSSRKIPWKIPSTLTLALLPVWAQAMSFGDLKRLIQDKNLKSIEEVLPLLPASLRSRYALIFQSRSLQEATLSNPRVILYGDAADFIVSFNGNEGQKGFNALETMEFDPRSREFSLREILFPAKNVRQKAHVVFSDSNPEKCLRCHGSSARPIWDTQPLWPGAYGERYFSPLAAEEQAGLAGFLAQQPNHPRYKNLQHVDIFSRKETFFPSHENRYSGHQEHSPNEILSSLLSQKNADRIVRQLSGSELFRSDMYLLLAALSKDCEPLPEFFPQGQREGFEKRVSSFVAHAEEVGKKQERLKEGRALSLHGAADETAVPISLDPLRFVAEEIGITTEQWTTALEAGSYDLAAPQPIDSVIEMKLLAAAARIDPRLQQLADMSRVSMPEKYCAYLREKSAGARIAIKALGVVQARKGELILAECAACHDGKVGPALPFLDSKMLSRQLTVGKYRHGTLWEEIIYRLSPQAGNEQMPLGENLSENEIRNLEDYLAQLKSRGSE